MGAAAAHHSYVAGMVKQALLDNDNVLGAVRDLMADMMVLVKPASVIKSVVSWPSPRDCVPLTCMRWRTFSRGYNMAIVTAALHSAVRRRL